MLRRLDRRQLALPIVIALTVVGSLLPTGGWWEDRTREVGRLARAPVVPFSHGLSFIGGKLHVEPPPVDTGPRDDEAWERLAEELELVRRQHLAERERVRQLEEQLAQLQNLPPETIRYASTRFIAHVAMRSPAGPDSIVTLKLPRSRAEAAREGSIVVYAGVHLLGRIVPPSSHATASVLPITNEKTGFLLARFFVEDDERGDDRVSLEPDDAGRFTASVRGSLPIEPGDQARLVDESWPRTAQMMVIGEVVDVEQDDDEPLRNIVTIRPRFDLAQLAYATVIEEIQEGTPVETAP